MDVLRTRVDSSGIAGEGFLDKKDAKSDSSKQ